MKTYYVVHDIINDDLDACPTFLTLEDARHYIESCPTPDELEILEVD